MLLKHIIVDKKFIKKTIKIVLNSLLMLLYSMQVNEIAIVRINYHDNNIKIIFISFE